MPNHNSAAQRTWRTLGFALAGVLAATLLVRAVAYAAFDVPHTFPLLQLGPTALWTAALVIGLAAARAYMQRRSGDAAKGFLGVAVRTLAVLALADIALLALHVFPGTATASLLTLLSMQGTASALSIYLLNTY